MSREALLESLAAVSEEGAVFMEDGRYLDFSVKIGDGRSLEVSDGEESVQMTLSRAELVALHAALTRTLLADAKS